MSVDEDRVEQLAGPIRSETSRTSSAPVRRTRSAAGAAM